MTISAFVDASVLFAASYSSTGASREIVRLAMRGNVQPFISDDVLEEVRRNLALKCPAALDVFHEIMRSLPFSRVAPTKEGVQRAALYIAAKDAPIIAGAAAARADFLVSLDRRHIVGVPEVGEKSGLRIVLPEELLAEIRRRETDKG